MRPLLAAALMAVVVWAPAAAERDRGAVTIEPRGGGGSSHERRSGGPAMAPAARARSFSPPVIMKMRRVEIPAPRRPEPAARVSPGLRPIAPPARDGRGAIIRQSPRLRPPQHASVVGDRRLVRSIESNRRVELVPRHYYWHNVSGSRYCHFFDGRAHWYGFYRGPHFYWTRYWSNFWWWYDPIFFRWVYWWNGYWWWPGPGGAPYVYVDNNYYPYEEANGAVIVKNPQVDQPPPASPPRAEAGHSYKSPEGRRLVQVTGDQGEAYLYDTSGREASFLTYLARGVSRARFSGGKSGKPLRVLLDFNDGSFALYDSEGKALDVKNPAATEAELPGPPPAPASIPSGPTSPPPQPPGEPPADE